VNKKAIAAISMILFFSGVSAQVAVDLSTYGMKVQTGQGNGSSVAVNSAGTIDSNVQMEGVAVINGDVFIDGEKVPKGKNLYKSRKSGKTYEIKWGGNGNVAVREK
jgi:hypothetical protein